MRIDYYKRDFEYQEIHSNFAGPIKSAVRYFKVLNCNYVYEWELTKGGWTYYNTYINLQLSGMSIKQISKAEAFIELL